MICFSIAFCLSAGNMALFQAAMVSWTMKSTSLALDTSPSSNGSANSRMTSDILGSPSTMTTRPAGTVCLLRLFFFDMRYVPCPAVGLYTHLPAGVTVQVPLAIQPVALGSS